MERGASKVPSIEFGEAKEHKPNSGQISNVFRKLRGARMTDTHAIELKRAIETEHGGRAQFIQSVPVHESKYGRTIWNGAVQVFDLIDSPSGATRVYAWSRSRADGQRETFSVLHRGCTTGPREAVREALQREGRA